jgi:hypothetical protein
MARKMSVREGVLLGVLALAGLTYFWVTSGPDAGGRSGGTGGGTGQKGKSDGSNPPVVRMDLLAARAESYDEKGRDLFKYSQRPPSAEEIRRLREEAARRQKEMEEANRRAVEEAQRQQKENEERVRQIALNPPPPPPPMPPAITMRYLGYLGPKEGRIAVFEDGGEMLVARKGEVVKGQFKVVDVKWDTVVMGFVKPEFKGMTQELAMTRGK